MWKKIQGFFRNSKVTTTEYLLLIAIWTTVVYKFSNWPDLRTESKESLIYDYVEPNMSAPHPSSFPYIQK